MNLAFPPLGTTDLVFGVIAGGMVAFNVWVLLQFFPRKEGAPTLSRAVLVAYVLASSSAMWVSVIFDLLSGNGDVGWTAVLFGIQFMMMAPFVWHIALILKGEELRVRLDRWFWPAFLAGLVVANEVLMGAVFVFAVGGPNALLPTGVWGPWLGFSRSVLSLWFLWAMFANMVPLLFWVPIPRREREGLLALAATGLTGPLVLVNVALGIGVTMALMTVALLLFLQRVLRHSVPQGAGYPRLLTGIAGAFSAMVVGQLPLVLQPNAPWTLLAFSFVMLAVMTGEMMFLVRTVLLRCVPGPVPTVELSPPAPLPAAA